MNVKRKLKEILVRILFVDDTKNLNHPEKIYI